MAQIAIGISALTHFAGISTCLRQRRGTFAQSAESAAYMLDVAPDEIAEHAERLITRYSTAATELLNANKIQEAYDLLYKALPLAQSVDNHQFPIAGCLSVTYRCDAPPEGKLARRYHLAGSGSRIAP